MSKKPIISHKFYNLVEDEVTTIQEIVEKNLTVKLDSYLKKIYATSQDAQVLIEYKVSREKRWKYEASFRFSYDGKHFVYKNNMPFKRLDDLINHAFDHFKRNLDK